MTLETIIDHKRLTNAGLRLALRRIDTVVRSPSTIPSKGIEAALVDIATELHARNREAGWWTDLTTGQPLQRNVGELLMLMVSELAEFPSYPRNESEKDDKLPNRLMATVELADCAIRIFDTMGALAPEAHTAFIIRMRVPPRPATGGLIPWQNADLALMRIVRLLSFAMECDRKKRTLTNPGGPDTGAIRGFDWYLGLALFTVFDTGWRLGLDVAGAVVEKVEYNQQRKDHKIEARRKPDGKQY